MKTLLVLRHAKSSWKTEGQSDHDRPLNDRGKRDAPEVGRRLKDHGLTPDCILSSTAKRAVKTAEKVAEACGFAGDILFLPELYLAPPSVYLNALDQFAEESDLAMVVGHNPGVEDLVQSLVGASGHFPTAALAIIEAPIENWRELRSRASARLVNLWRPKDAIE